MKLFLYICTGVFFINRVLLKDADILFGEARDVFENKREVFCYYSYFQPLIVLTKDCVNLD